MYPQVLATSQPAALARGQDMLDEGASAVDAALVVAAMQTTLCAGSWDSFAGISSLLYFDARARTVSSLNGGYNTVRHEHAPATIPTPPRPSGRTALVPGFMAAAGAAHQELGSLPFTAVLDPAVRIAEEGFVVDSLMAKLFRYRRDVLTRTPEGRMIFAAGESDIPRVGDLFRQPDLARTLRRVGIDGPDFMYTGPWGDRLVAVVQREGGALTGDDLAAYKPVWTEPVTTRYRGRTVYSAGLPNLGGTRIVEALNLLQRVDLRSMGHPSVSSDALYWLIQIAHAFLLEPAVDAGDRLQEEHAAWLWREIQRRGGLRLFDIIKLHTTIGRHSDAVVTADRQGNVAVLCHSSNTIDWGTTGLFVDGVSIPDSASFQQDQLRRIPPGSRLPDPMNPVIVVDEDGVVAAGCFIGTALHELALQTLVDVLDFGLTPGEQDAEHPSYFLDPHWSGIFSTRWQENRGRRILQAAALSLLGLVASAAPSVAERLSPPQHVAAGGFTDAVLDGVRARGQRVKETPAGWLLGQRVWLDRRTLLDGRDREGPGDPDRGGVQRGLLPRGGS